MINLISKNLISLQSSFFNQSYKYLPYSIQQYNSIVPKYHFSKYFQQKDIIQIDQYNMSKTHKKFYRDLVKLWKVPLQRKRLRRQRLRPIKQAMKRKQNQQEKLVIHNPAVGIQYPPKYDQLFCIVKINGRQHKVTNDCVVILDNQQSHQINKQIIFDQVLLVGTKTYSLIGRPIIQNAKVQAIVQSISKTQKVIVFKKKRRKGYKKSFGSRNLVTSIRINNIIHQLTENVLNKAVSIQ